MPKLRPVAVAGLLSAAALAVPVAAHAATAYQPKTVGDPAGDVMSASGKVYPDSAIDVVKVHGVRYRNNFSVVVTYADLKPQTYTRHLMYLIDSDEQTHAKVLELRSAADGSAKASTTRLYYIKTKDGAIAGSIAKVSCGGARAVPNFTKDTITYTLPVSCYGLTPDSAVLASANGKWTAKTWDAGSVTVGDMPQLADSTTARTWQWTPESNPARPAGQAARLLF